MSTLAAAPAATPPAPARARIRGAGWGVWLAFGLIAAFLLAFLIVPIGLVIYTAFVDESNRLTLGHFANFFGQTVFVESFLNSLWVSLASVAVATLIAVPLAYLTVRFEVRGALLIQTLGVLPLIMGVSMYFQQKLNPTPPDPTQARLMQWMPVIFTFMLANFPAGLVIYWTTNTVLTIFQQWIIMRHTSLDKPRMART